MMAASHVKCPSIPSNVCHSQACSSNWQSQTCPPPPELSNPIRDGQLQALQFSTCPCAQVHRAHIVPLLEGRPPQQEVS